MRATSLVALALLVACGGGADDDGGDGPGIDAATVVADAGPDATPVAQCGVPEDHGALGALAGAMAVRRNQPGSMGLRKLYVMDVTIDGAAAPDVLELALWDEVGVFTGAVAPGTYMITGDETSFATCGACVAIYADKNAVGAPARAYMASGGSMTIDSLTPMLAGSLSRVSFIEVDPVSMMPIDGATCATGIESVSFSATVQIIN